MQSEIRDQQTEGNRILVVDDDPAVGHLMAMFLEREGFEAKVCDHPREALRIAEKEQFALAFVDIRLPEMSGLELAALLKKKDEDLEIVFITGFGNVENAIQALRVGACDYLQKPIERLDLKWCLKRFSERRELQERVRVNEQRYFRLVQNLPSLIVVVRGDFQLAFVNQASKSMLGYTPEEALGEPDWFLARIHLEDLNRVKTAFLSAFRSSTSHFSVECRLRHRTGHLIHAMIKSIPLPTIGNMGSPKLIQGLAVDITDRVILEQSTVQKEKIEILGAVLSEVAHEIRNPLVTIGGFARRLRKSHPELREGDIIVREVKRLEEILAKIMVYLQPVEITRAPASINAIVKKVEAGLALEMKEAGVGFQVESGVDLSDLYTDQNVLERVITQLLRDTVARMAEGGTIHLKTFESDAHLHLELKASVSRSGLKDPVYYFMPLEDSDENMGLPLSFRILKQMGGLLSLVQEREHLVLTLSLPVPCSDRKQKN